MGMFSAVKRFFYPEPEPEVKKPRRPRKPKQTIAVAPPSPEPKPSASPVVKRFIPDDYTYADTKLTAAQLKGYTYDPETGIIRTRAGQPMGSPGKNPRFRTMRTTIASQAVRCDRLAYRLHTGQWPVGTSVPLDGDETNLKWTNLLWRNKPVEEPSTEPEPEPVRTRIFQGARQRSDNPDVATRMVGITERVYADGTIVYEVRIRATTDPSDKTRVTLGKFSNPVEAQVVRDQYIRDHLPGWEIRGCHIKQIKDEVAEDQSKAIAKACLAADKRFSHRMFSMAERRELRHVVALGANTPDQEALLQRARERAIRIGPLG